MKKKLYVLLLASLVGMVVSHGSLRQAHAQADEDTVKCAKAVSKAFVDYSARVYEAKSKCESARLQSSRPRFCPQDERLVKDLASAKNRLARELGNCRQGAIANLCPLGAQSVGALSGVLTNPADPLSIVAQLDEKVRLLFVSPISVDQCSPRPAWDAARAAEECSKVMSRDGGELLEELQVCFADCELKQMSQDEVEHPCVNPTTGAPEHTKVIDCVHKEVSGFFSTMDRKCTDEGIDLLGCPDGQSTSSALATSMATDFLELSEALNLSLFHSVCRSETGVVVAAVPSSATLLPSGKSITVSCGTVIDEGFMEGNSILSLDSNVNCDAVLAEVDGLMVSASGITIDGHGQFGIVGMDRSRFRLGAGIRLLAGATNVTIKNLKSIRRFGVGIADSGSNSGLRVEKVDLRRNDLAGMEIFSPDVVIDGIYSDRNKVGVILDGDNIVLRDSIIRRSDGSRGIGLLIRGTDEDNSGAAVQVRDVFFEHNGVGIDVVGSQHRLIDNRITRSRYTGIEADTQESLFDGNLIRDSRQGFGLEIRGTENTINRNQSESNGLAGFAITGNGNMITSNYAGDERRGNGSKGGGITVTGIENKLGDNGSYSNRPTQYLIGRYNQDLGGNLADDSGISFGSEGTTVE